MNNMEGQNNETNISSEGVMNELDKNHTHLYGNTEPQTPSYEETVTSIPITPNNQAHPHGVTEPQQQSYEEIVTSIPITPNNQAHPHGITEPQEYGETTEIEEEMSQGRHL